MPTHLKKKRRQKRREERGLPMIVVDDLLSPWGSRSFGADATPLEREVANEFRQKFNINRRGIEEFGRGFLSELTTQSAPQPDSEVSIEDMLQQIDKAVAAKETRDAETERLVWPFKAEALRRALDGDVSLLNKITELEAEQGWMNQMMGRGFGLYGQVLLDPICSPSDPIKKAPCKD